MRIFPISVHNAERDVLVRWSRAEHQQHRLLIARLLNDLVRRRLALVDEVRVEYVELDERLSNFVPN